MARSLDDIMKALPPTRRARIERRADELIRTLRDVRRAVDQTQVELARALGVRQDTVSRIERRSDLLLSTLRRYVRAAGGELELVARFPNRAPLILDHLSEPAGSSGRRGRSARPRAQEGQRTPAGRTRSSRRIRRRRSKNVHRLLDLDGNV